MSNRLLIVDDDALMRRSLAFNLEQAGYKVVNAANAEDALALARRDPPDLVLLDIGFARNGWVRRFTTFQRKITNSGDLPDSSPT